jgi:ABC-type uncharacterized transport system auxiliary subunit
MAARMRLRPIEPLARARVASYLMALAVLLAGCGFAANTSPATLPSANAGPTALVGSATGATFGAIRTAL